MGFLEQLSDLFTTKNRYRKYIFLGIGLLLLTIIIIIICVATSGGDSNNEEKNSGGGSKTEEEEEKEEEEKEEPKTPFEAYLNSKKYLYVWTYPNAENLIKFLVDHKYSKIFLYVGCVQWDLENLIKGDFYQAGDMEPKLLIQKLIEKNIEVELCMYLNDGVNNFENVDKIPEIAKVMGELQKTLKFTALHFDVEPSSYANLEPLLHMYEDSRKFVKVSAILKPGWLSIKMSSLESSFTSADYFKKFKDCETYVDAIMMVTDYSDVMAYSNNYDTVDKFLDKYDTIRKRHPEHIAKPVLELDPAANADSTYDRYKEDNDKFFEYFVNVSKRFKGVTIHHYTSWCEDLYCEKVEKYSEYYFGTPKNC